jgi:hypothetical protein
LSIHFDARSCAAINDGEEGTDRASKPDCAARTHSNRGHSRVNKEITDHTAAIIKASGLPVKSVNEISEQLRKWLEEEKSSEAGVDKPG